MVGQSDDRDRLHGKVDDPVGRHASDRATAETAASPLCRWIDMLTSRCRRTAAHCRASPRTTPQRVHRVRLTRGWFAELRLRTGGVKPVLPDRPPDRRGEAGAAAHRGSSAAMPLQCRRARFPEHHGSRPRRFRPGAAGPDWGKLAAPLAAAQPRRSPIARIPTQARPGRSERVRDLDARHATVSDRRKYGLTEPSSRSFFRASLDCEETPSS